MHPKKASICRTIIIFYGSLSGDGREDNCDTRYSSMSSDRIIAMY